MIEILRFRLAEGTDAAAFLEADKQVQTEFAYQQPGLVRRTLARSDDGAWVVIDLWHTAAQAEACDAKWGQDAVTAAFMGFVDEDSVTVERYVERG